MKITGIPTIWLYLSVYVSRRALMIREWFDILQVLLLVPLALTVLYLFIFSLAGLFYREPEKPETESYQRIAVLIPAYREDAVLGETLEALMHSTYPDDRFTVFLIADSLTPETLDAIRTMRVKLIEVKTTDRTKAKALNLALEHIQDSFDLVLVLDADNVISQGYLEKLNAVMHEHVSVLQTRRSPKNQTNALAILDGISEEINNHIFRKGHRVLGFPAALSGSGMGFRFGLFREMMGHISAVGGMDKEMEMWLLRNNVNIFYLHDSPVFDEKTSRPETFRTQRRRWIAAQYHYFFSNVRSSGKALLKEGNLAWFQKVLQMLMPPRAILLAQIAVFGVLSLMLNELTDGNDILPLCWALTGILLLISLGIAIPRKSFDRKLFQALWYLPKGIFLMVSALFSIRGANKQFLHTPHIAGKSVSETFRSHEKD